MAIGAATPGAAIGAQRSLLLPVARRAALPASQNLSWPLAAKTPTPPTTTLKQYGSARRHLGGDMRQVQINKAHHAACARRQRDNDEVLSLDLRDHDIARAKRIQAASGSRIARTRGEATT